MNLPPAPKRMQDCTTCRAPTEHVLTPTPSGCSWKCPRCGALAGAYTYAQMRDVVTAFFPAPDPATLPPVPDITGVRVFLEGGHELAPHSLQTHVELARELPRVGEPVFGRAPDLPAHLAKVPYGKVVRVVRS